MSGVLQLQRAPWDIREIVVSYRILHACIFYDQKQVYKLKDRMEKCENIADNFFFFLQSEFAIWPNNNNYQLYFWYIRLKTSSCNVS